MDKALLWTIIGAIGSSFGAMIGSVALIIAIKAYLLPIKRNIKATLTSGFFINETMSIDVFSIQVTNSGVRPITVGSIGLGYDEHTIFLDSVPRNTVLQFFEPKYPVKLEQGSYVTFYLPRDLFIAGMIEQFGNKPELHNKKMYIKVSDDSTTGLKIKTHYYLKDFLG